MRIQPEDEKINYEAKYTESTFKRVVKTLLSVSERLQRPDKNREDSPLVYCPVKYLFHTFSFLIAYDSVHKTPNTCSQFYMQHLIYICNTENSLYICLFYCIFRNKTKKNALFGDVFSPQLYSFFLMIVLQKKMD